MGIDDIFSWYQQKIGTYDKQKWETRIEQREQLKYGLNHIKTRSAKLNNDLIDLDLVRGSSFTKTKPKHGFIKVTKLASLRLILLPLFAKWWIKETSKYVFGISLFLYSCQVINIIIYLFFTTSNASQESLSCMEILIPLIMMWVLSLIHSQIVATSPSAEIKKVRFKNVHYRRRRNFNNVKKRRSRDQESVKLKPETTKTSIKNDNVDVDVKSEKSDDNNKIIDVHENNTSDSLIKPEINGSCSTDSEGDIKSFKQKRKPSLASRLIRIPTIDIRDTTTVDSDDEVLSSPEIGRSVGLVDDMFSTDWMGVTTNSEDCSYSSDNLENISDSEVENNLDYSVFDNDLAPTDMLTPTAVKVSCIVWERNEMKIADLSMLDISSSIICKVDSMPENMDYFCFGIVLSTILALLPVVCRVVNSSSDIGFVLDAQHILEDIFANVTSSLPEHHDSVVMFYQLLLKEVSRRLRSCLCSAFDGDSWEYIVMLISSFERWILASTIFFLLAVAERTFKQRLLYAKLFSHLTSSRRARKSDIPHFRLNKVLNIKTWLSVRSYMKRRGPQRSVDVIVSTAFVANLLLLTFLCVEVLKDTVLFSQYYLEALIWCVGLGILLLRFMTLGTKINKKYRNLSVLITEQINLHLQMEQKPHKKEELNVSNNVLKLAIDLLKELENPFKISGLSANPILYNCTKLVILSALSGVLSEMLGFKLKLHKIKLK